MTKKKLKPRKRDGRVTFNLVVTDGDEPIIKVKEGRLSALEEVIETLKKKL